MGCALHPGFGRLKVVDKLKMENEEWQWRIEGL